MRYELEQIVKYFPKRIQNSHKGTFGRILNISGSQNYSGAAILSSLAALKAGAGYVTLACPDIIVKSIASYTPDITFLPLKSTCVGSISPENTNSVLSSIRNYDVISIGSGLTTKEETKKFVIELLNKIEKPIVIDADALNIIAIENIEKIPKNSIMTPHPKELSRLLNVSVEEIQTNREKYAIIGAEKYNTIMVLKGHETIVTDGKNIFINKTGNSSLAKAGSGDILTGITAGLVAQMRNNNECEDNLFYAAANSVFLHGMAGELASKELSEYSVLASEQIKYISQAIKKHFPFNKNIGKIKIWNKE